MNSGTGFAHTFPWGPSGIGPSCPSTLPMHLDFDTHVRLIMRPALFAARGFGQAPGFLSTARAAASLMLGLAILMALPASSEANIIISAQEVGSDVIFSLTGSLDTTIFPSAAATGASAAFVHPSIPSISFAPSSGSMQTYNLGATPAWPAFGSGGSLVANSHSGDGLYMSISSGNRFLDLPAGYVSGTSLTSTMTFTGKTLLSMGITPGTYNFQVPNTGSSQLQVVQLQAVPEPSTSSMLLAVVILGGGWISRRKRVCRESAA